MAKEFTQIIEVIDDFGGNVIGTFPEEGNIIRITTIYTGGKPDKIEEKIYHEPVPVVEKHVYNVDITYKDTLLESPPGLINDGKDSIYITLTIKNSKEKVLNVSKNVRLVFNWNGGGEGRVIKISFVEGLAKFTYTTTGIAGTLSADKNSLAELVPDGIVKIRGDNLFIIAEDYTLK